MKTALVYGAGGIISCYLVKRLKGEDFWVAGQVETRFGDTGPCPRVGEDRRVLGAARFAVPRSPALNSLLNPRAE